MVHFIPGQLHSTQRPLKRLGPIPLSGEPMVATWGISIIPDSAQFSVLVADHAKGDQAGSLLTFQTALGFALKIATVQLIPVVADILGWPIMMGLLALGPLFGIMCMLGLTKRAISNAMI